MAEFPIAEKLYKESQAQQGPQGEAPNGGDGNYYDASYEDKT